MKPLKFYIDLSNKTYTISKEGWEYINQLREELKRLKPNVVVAMGNIPLIALTNRVGITKWRGSVIESTIIPGLKVVPAFHPATFIPPKFNFLNKPLIVSDLKLALAESKYPELHRLPREIKIKPSFDETIAILKFARDRGLSGQTLDIDLEVINEEVDCFSVAWSPAIAASIPFRDNQGDYFNVEQELEIMRWLCAIMQDDRIPKRGANFIFDTQFLLRKYRIRPAGPLHCTQIAQKIAFPDYPAGLDFVTTMHTDIPYYKDDGKKWMKMGTGTWEEWWNYNGMDAISTSAAHPSQMDDLKRQGNLETYERQRKLMYPLLYMMERGIRIDAQGILDNRKTEAAKLDSLAIDLNKEVGHEINYNSPKQVADYFYRDLKIKPYKKRNAKGQYKETTDVDALKRLARRDYQAARIMLDIRSLSKRISTYMNIKKVDPDGRYRSAYKPVGAETGRLSSGETIFGTGGNQQNWPHDLLRYFLFDEGYVGYSYDLSQIENRIVAYVGGIGPMIKAFEDGTDLHRLTASMFFGIPYDEISSEDGSSDLGDGRQSQRFWGKKGNHGLNYDLGYKQFALKYEITEREAKWLVETYHRAYPGVRQNYHALVQNNLKKNRTLTNLFGRKRVFMGPVIPNPPGVPLSACHVTYKEGYAQIPQSTTADKINEHGMEYIYYDQDMFRPVELLAQIHDSIVFQIPLSVPWKQHADILIHIKRSLEIPLEWRSTKFRVPADLCIGQNMCKEDMFELKSAQISENIVTLADKLEDIYNGLTKKEVG
jgi:DNA polymerase I-like protein with 3'-5' exonuclease and polymerase domains